MYYNAYGSRENVMKRMERESGLWRESVRENNVLAGCFDTGVQVRAIY